MPILNPDGTTLPDPVTYVPLAEAVTSIVTNGVVTSTRPPVAGEPAADANHFDDALQSITTTVNAVLTTLQSTGGVRVYNEAAGSFETWPAYISATDPELASNPPAGNYVWLLPATSDGPGSSGIATDTDGTPYFT